MSKDQYVAEITHTESEFKKVIHLVEPIIKGKRGLDLGCGGFKIPGAIGVDSRTAPHVDIVADVTDPNLFGLIESKFGSIDFDYISSSHLLEDFELPVQIELSQRWLSYVNSGAFFINYVPEKGVYKGTNFAHKHEYVRGDMEALFQFLELEPVMFYYESAWHESWYGILGIGRKK